MAFADVRVESSRETFCCIMHIHGQIPYGYEAGKAKGGKSSETRSFSSFETQLNEKLIPAKERWA